MDFKNAWIIEHYSSIDARMLHRAGALRDKVKFTITSESLSIEAEIRDSALWLKYSRNEKEYYYPIVIETNQCNYGGVRYWFRCPANGCNRRVAILYRPDKIFACRNCHNLRYKIENETKHSRLFTNANRIRERLNWQGGIAHGKGAKPKGMHWKTFEKLENRHDHLAEQAIAISLEILLKQRALVIHNI